MNAYGLIFIFGVAFGIAIMTLIFANSIIRYEKIIKNLKEEGKNYDSEDKR